MKKILAIALTVIMLMTALPFSSFALFSKLPKVKNIIFETDDPIYYSALKKDLDDLYKHAEEYDYELEDIDFIYDICHHLNDYEITLEFTDGTSITIDEDVYSTESYDITVWAEVDMREATAAFETGATTVPVDVYAYIENDYKDYTSDTFTVDFDIAECYFREIEYISGLPDEISEFEDHLDLDGYKFKVTYADGTEKTVVLEDDEEYGYNIDGKYVISELDVENKKVKFFCFDAECSGEANIIDYPFYSLSITSYTHNLETGALESIEFEVYMDDDSTKTYICNDIEYIVSDDPTEIPYAVVGQIEGLNIILRSDVSIEETYPPTMYVYDEIVIEGTDIYDSVGSIYEEPGSSNPIRAFFAKLVSVFYRIVAFIRNLLA